MQIYCIININIQDTERATWCVGLKLHHREFNVYWQTENGEMQRCACKTVVTFTLTAKNSESVEKLSLCKQIFTNMAFS